MTFKLSFYYFCFLCGTDFKLSFPESLESQE